MAGAQPVMGRLFMRRLSIDKKTADGCECDYFTQGDGTGLKVYMGEKRAYATHDVQDFLSMYGVAPRILSDVEKIDYRTFWGPKFHPCTAWGYVTEEVKVADTLPHVSYPEGLHLKEEIRDILHRDHTLNGYDYHNSNWGFDSNGNAVFLDVGMFCYDTEKYDWRSEYEQKKKERDLLDGDEVEIWRQSNRNSLRANADITEWVLHPVQWCSARPTVRIGRHIPEPVSETRGSEGTSLQIKYRAGVNCPADCYAGPCCTACDERA
jgi:hypothetical protein